MSLQKQEFRFDPNYSEILERVSLFRGYPEKLRVDNGPEFISLALADWRIGVEPKLWEPSGALASMPIIAVRPRFS